jgi:[CysO sulfur-carrier protein]-S-L-cysteine hydrolase
MRISRQLLDELVEHARAEAPNECCGIVATRDGEAVAVHRVANAEASPLRYRMDAREQYDVMQAIEDAGLDVGVIYHSHTRSAPYPSQTDVNLAALWPDQLFVIVGVDGEEPEVRAFSIVDRQVTERPIEVT